jgi:hypothetical protein
MKNKGDKKTGNPLDELFTDANSQINPASLAAVLKPFLRINKENKRIIFTPHGMNITANNKIILFVLARKAMFLQGISESDSIRPKEIKEELGKSIPTGTIDAALKYLSEKGPLKGQDRRYFIPDFNFPQVEEIFNKLIK